MRPAAGREGGHDGAGDHETVAALAARLTVTRPIVLVGLMGAGKTTVGKRLATALNLPFKDADHEIETAAGRTVQEIFDERGEAEFRRGERLVILRLLRDAPHVLATGGGAFMDTRTRAAVKEKAVSVWLRADLDVLMRRVERREGRPLLRAADPRAVMERLMKDRYPTYAEADIVVDSGPGPHATAVEAILAALEPFFGAPTGEPR